VVTAGGVVLVTVEPVVLVVVTVPVEATESVPLLVVEDELDAVLDEFDPAFAGGIAAEALVVELDEEDVVVGVPPLVVVTVVTIVFIVETGT
jgi:hypothetical protein